MYSKGAVDKIVEVAKGNLCILFTSHKIHVHAWSLEIEISILEHNNFKTENEGYPNLWCKTWNGRWEWVVKATGEDEKTS